MSNPANAETLPTSESAWRFAVIGNLPYTEADIRQLPDLFDVIRRQGSVFILHTGGFKSPQDSCDDALFKSRYKLLNSSPLPLFYTPGDQEWVRCEQSAGTTYDSRERLSRLRELFFADSQSLGLNTLPIQQQSNTRHFRNYPENTRWEYKNVLFLTLNLPGTNNNFVAGAGRNGEFEDRLQASHFWLQHAFAQATRKRLPLLIIAFQGNPFEAEGSLKRDAYVEFRHQLATLAADYKGEVLLIHSGQSHHQPDHPLLNARGEILHNVSRIESFNPPLTHDWIEVEVTPETAKRASRFNVKVMKIEEADDSTAVSDQDN